MSLIINTVISTIANEFLLEEPEWKTADITKSDIKFIKDECSKSSEFDPTNKRLQMYNNMMSGQGYICVNKCKYGTVIAVFDNLTEMNEVPWGLWARIFRIYSTKSQKPFRVYFMANMNRREFPEGDKEITPENINGGYTYRCTPDTIFIYRAEDATRVLIHELQHSCCLDNIDNSVDIIEAETEAWAELIYVALLSQGKKYMFKDFIQRQSEWMRKQNEKVRKHMKDPDSKEFPWRYTIGKEEVWRRWGILRDDNMKPYVNVGNSLRLTLPPTDIIKDKFEVSRNSIVL
jgi:hypothetical protein